MANRTRAIHGLAALAAGAVLAIAPAAGRADEVRSRAMPRLGVEAMTDYPLDVGARAWGELPGRIVLDGSVGYLPPAYLDQMNRLMVARGTYSQDTAEMVNTALHSSMVWRVHVGWRPLERRGLYAGIGYGVAQFGGGVQNSDVIARTTDVSVPFDLGDVEVSSRLQMIDVEVGWRWWVRDDVSIRAGVGWVTTVAADTTVSPHLGPLTPFVPDEAGQSAGRVLDELALAHIKLPVLSLAIGWRIR